MESEFHQIELTVESDQWNTIWLIKKTLYEGEKRKTPVKIEVRSNLTVINFGIRSELKINGIIKCGCASVPE